MQAQTKPYIGSEESLVLERQAEYKSEYWNGEMFAMAGADVYDKVDFIDKGSRMKFIRSIR